MMAWSVCVLDIFKFTQISTNHLMCYYLKIIHTYVQIMSKIIDRFLFIHVFVVYIKLVH